MLDGILSIQEILAIVIFRHSINFIFYFSSGSITLQFVQHTSISGISWLWIEVFSVVGFHIFYVFLDTFVGSWGMPHLISSCILLECSRMVIHHCSFDLNRQSIISFLSIPSCYVLLPALSTWSFLPPSSVTLEQLPGRTGSAGWKLFSVVQKAPMGDSHQQDVYLKTKIFLSSPSDWLNCQVLSVLVSATQEIETTPVIWGQKF